MSNDYKLWSIIGAFPREGKEITISHLIQVVVLLIRGDSYAHKKMYFHYLKQKLSFLSVVPGRRIEKKHVLLFIKLQKQFSATVYHIRRKKIWWSFVWLLGIFHWNWEKTHNFLIGNGGWILAPESTLKNPWYYMVFFVKYVGTIIGIIRYFFYVELSIRKLAMRNLVFLFWFCCSIEPHIWFWKFLCPR